MQEKRNARFWTFWNGDFVKLTLQPHDQIILHRAGKTEEGWWHEAKSFQHNGSKVTFLIDEGGRDCDGYTEHHETLVCPLGELHSGMTPCQVYHHFDHEPPEKVVYPNWRSVDKYQRDQFAEAMGY